MAGNNATEVILSWNRVPIHKNVANVSFAKYKKFWIFTNFENIWFFKKFKICYSVLVNIRCCVKPKAKLKAKRKPKPTIKPKPKPKLWMLIYKFML
jgi:hypothetical protein